MTTLTKRDAARLTHEVFSNRHAHLYHGLRQRYEGSQAWLLTLTFPPQRFVSWRWETSSRSMLLPLKQASYDFFGKAHELYRILTTRLVSHSDRPSKRLLGPHLHAYVDDKDHESDGVRYPHLHCVLWLHPKTVQRLAVIGGTAEIERLWRDLSEGGTFHVLPLRDNVEDFDRAFSYASKLEARVEAWDDGSWASRSWPEDYISVLKALLP